MSLIDFDSGASAPSEDSQQKKSKLALLRNNAQKLMRKNERLTEACDRANSNIELLEQTLRSRMDLILNMKNEREDVMAKQKEMESRMAAMEVLTGEKERECRRLVELNEKLTAKVGNGDLQRQLKLAHKRNEELSHDLSELLEASQANVEGNEDVGRLRAENEELKKRNDEQVSAFLVEKNEVAQRREQLMVTFAELTEKQRMSEEALAKRELDIARREAEIVEKRDQGERSQERSDVIGELQRELNERRTEMEKVERMKQELMTRNEQFNSDAAQMRQKEQQLRDSVAAFEQRKREFEELTRVEDARSVEIGKAADERLREYKAKLNDVGEHERMLKQREEGLARTVQDLEARERQLAQKLSVMKQRDALARRERSELDMAKNEMGRTRERLDSKETDVSDRELRVTGVERQCQRQIIDLERRESEYEAQMNAIESREEAVAEREREADRRQRILSEREAHVAECDAVIEASRLEVQSVTNSLNEEKLEHERVILLLEEQKADFRREIEDKDIRMRELEDQCHQKDDLKRALENEISEMRHVTDTLRKQISTSTSVERDLGKQMTVNDELVTQNLTLQRQIDRLRQRFAKFKRKVMSVEAKHESMTRCVMDEVRVAYLKKVFMQFFAHDGQTKGKLIPVILSVIGCNESEIEFATRQWTEDGHFINHGFWKNM